MILVNRPPAYQWKVQPPSYRSDSPGWLLICTVYNTGGMSVRGVAPRVAAHRLCRRCGFLRIHHNAVGWVGELLKYNKKEHYEVHTTSSLVGIFMGFILEINLRCPSFTQISGNLFIELAMLRDLYILQLLLLLLLLWHNSNKISILNDT